MISGCGILEHPTGLSLRYFCNRCRLPMMFYTSGMVQNTFQRTVSPASGGFPLVMVPIFPPLFQKVLRLQLFLRVMTLTLITDFPFVWKLSDAVEITYTKQVRLVIVDLTEMYQMFQCYTWNLMYARIFF